MSDKNLLTWMGFKKSDLPDSARTNSDSAHSSSSSDFAASSSSAVTMSSSVNTSQASRNSQASKSHLGSASLERIRELEAQLADLRSRRDITSLTKEEFEILATETAMNLIRTAQAREARAMSTAQKAIDEAKTVSEQLRNDAEIKARGILSAAEGRGKKYLDAAESQARELLSQAQASAESLLESKRRESVALASAAKKEAERLIQEATGDIATFKNWLGSAISESERLHRIQVQSLSSAEEAIRQTRSRLATAFEKLEALGTSVNASLTAEDRPIVKSAQKEVASAGASEPIKKTVTKKAVTKKAATEKSSPKNGSATRAATKKKTAAKRK